MQIMQSNLYNKAFLLILSLTMTACGDKTSQKVESISVSGTAKTDVSKNTSQTIDFSAPPPGGYSVAETFNVGDNIYVRSMIADENSRGLWVGTSIGVIEVDLNTRDMRNTYTRNEGLANEYVFGMLVDQDNAKWFGTNGGGMTRFKDGTWKTYFPMHGLADYWVYSFAQQSDGTIWVGTWAGLSRFNPQTAEFKTYVKELVNEWVYGLDVDSKDQLWIGTEGGVNMYDGKTWQVWTHKEGLGAANSQHLPVSDNTGLGTRERHDLSVLQQGGPTYNPNYVFSLMVAADDTIWAGTWGGGVSHFDGKSWTNYTKDQGLAGNIVYSVAQDEKGALWFGTNGGLSKYDGKQWITLTKENGLVDNNIYAIAPTKNDEIWIGGRSAVMLLTKAAK